MVLARWCKDIVFVPPRVCGIEKWKGVFKNAPWDGRYFRRIGTFAQRIGHYLENLINEEGVERLN